MGAASAIATETPAPIILLADGLLCALGVAFVFLLSPNH